MNRTSASITLIMVASGSALADITVRSGAGADAAAIQAAVDGFRADVSLGGTNNGNSVSVLTTGRREINWDAAIADPFQSPDLMPGDFFNKNVTRGAVISTPGDGLLLSQRVAADASGSNLRFGDIDASYSSQFQTFSPARLFAARSSTIIDTVFRVPGQPGVQATVNGFGAVFTGVDLAGVSSLEFFDLADNCLRREEMGVSPGGLSFVGVTFDAGVRIARVRMTLGNAAMAPGVLNSAGLDIVAADDFIYGEPLAVPAPGSLALALAGLAALRRRR